ncbi:MAG: hypothetical protein HZY76_03670 [Anaerolineae bacterium]|nr:MAG: hypothetical protein HZY76_03670 [Anaerolineae bacterium]
MLQGWQFGMGALVGTGVAQGARPELVEGAQDVRVQTALALEEVLDVTQGQAQLGLSLTEAWCG